MRLPKDPVISDCPEGLFGDYNWGLANTMKPVDHCKDLRTLAAESLYQSRVSKPREQ